jgi:Galactose oxidase, central domain
MASIIGSILLLAIGILVLGRYRRILFGPPAPALPVAMVCGGDGGLDAAATIELYFPSSGNQVDRFVSDAFLVQPRRSHTATRLTNGKILIAGGDNGGAIADAEIYDWTTSDPMTPKSKATAEKMKHARAYHTATPIDQGMVLLAGGINPAGVPVAHGDRYLPDTNTFDNTVGQMQHPRYDHVAIKLQDGRVLFTGGQAADGTLLNDAEIYESLGQTFTLLANTMSVPRLGHAMALLDNGDVLIVGGVSTADGPSIASAEIFEPINQTFSPVAQSMNYRRTNASATTLNNGRVLIAGGLDYRPDLEPAADWILDSAEIFALPSSGAATAGSFTTVPGGMTARRELHTASLLVPGEVLLAGGQDSSGSIATAVIYHPDSNSFAPAASMNQSRQLHAATAL